ncbi:MAG: hypothetical protein HDQ90_07525, partial [Desulfovibrio sp.]|nr:hypothetical protein [Desulfovibrio sp.]
LPPAPEPELPPDLPPDLLEDGEIDLSNLPPDDIDMAAPEAAAAFEPAAAQAASPGAPPAAPQPPEMAGPELPPEGEDDGLAWIPPLGDAGADGPVAPAAAAEKLDPSLAELEEELFPLDAPEAAAGGGVPAPGVSPEDLLPPDLAPGLQQDERDEVLAHGGFLPGN